jgi:hypothetical protein
VNVFLFFVSRRYCVPARTFLTIQRDNRSPYLTICMNVPELYLSVFDLLRPFNDKKSSETARNVMRSGIPFLFLVYWGFLKLIVPGSSSWTGQLSLWSRLNPKWYSVWVLLTIKGRYETKSLIGGYCRCLQSYIFQRFNELF